MNQSNSEPRKSGRTPNRTARALPVKVGSASGKRRMIQNFYRRLLDTWGPQHWWPGETQLEVIVGAILTQNTSWTNVERALNQLRSANLLTLEGLRRLPTGKLEKLIRSSGYFRQKAARLKAFVAFIDQKYGGSLEKMFASPTAQLREQLLALNGIGPETADSILLYAGQHAVFVVDAYTRRMVDRHGILPDAAPYEDIRRLFEESLKHLKIGRQGKGMRDATPAETSPASHPPSPMSRTSRSAEAQAYNEMHGLIVSIGKNYCRKAGGRCEQCPLRSYLPGYHE
jgi:endonuclease III related protein